METFHVYIIFSGGINKFYVGYTSDLPRRLDEHNSGVSIFTSRANDWELKYVETFPSRQAAMKREQGIKNKKSRKYIEWLIQKI